jgi:hypothetical protein
MEMKFAPWPRNRRGGRPRGDPNAQSRRSGPDATAAKDAAFPRSAMAGRGGWPSPIRVRRMAPQRACAYRMNAVIRENPWPTNDV